MIEAIQSVVGRYPAYGFSKVFTVLRRGGRPWNHKRVIRVLERIVAWRGYPAKTRMDNGPEFVSAALAEWADDHAVQLEFIQPGKPTQNSYVERFNRTYRTEVLDMYAFRRLSEVREITDNWIREYNEERPHDSLGDLTPREYLMANSRQENSKSTWH